MYNFLIDGHKKYGLKKDTLCKSVLKCNDEAIKENVIIAPWWEPTIFKDIESELIVDTSIKIWNCKLFDKNITYIKTGIGASVCTDVILALGNSNCKKIIFIGSVGAVLVINTIQILSLIKF
ncbi:MAG: phosphorylase [Clostridium perfringens]|nr:phosphorylase [Clostridium perfringens]